MKIVTLFENRTISKEFKNKHGLALYIETSKHKILFDTGTDKTFADNAVKLGVKLEEVDIAVISHGHYDHGGGLKTFLELNKKAKVYIGRGAFDNHLVKLLGLIKVNIGLEEVLYNKDRFIFIDDVIKIDDEIALFGSIKGNRLTPHDNHKMLKEYSGGIIDKDDFNHEINLLVNEGRGHSLFCGCAHKGIINIIERAKEVIGCNVDTVIGGFHLIRMNVKKQTSKDFLNELSSMLAESNVGRFYTCHCTSEEAYDYLREKLNNLDEIKTGMVIEI